MLKSVNLNEENIILANVSLIQMWHPLHQTQSHSHAPDMETLGLKKPLSFSLVITTLWLRSCAFNS